MRTLHVILLSVVLGACGGNGGGDGDAGIDHDAFPGDAFNFADADPNAPDAGQGGCDPQGTECSNCVDDDDDGFIDGFDIHCSSPLDDDEGSFETGIPGDNKDEIWQDCFFDGDSGAGNDGCQKYHICCLLQPNPCPADLRPDQFDPAECVVSQECINNCGAITPPGCDCFGCCTLCNDTGCVDVATNPNISPDCTLDQLQNPDVCVPCTQNTECGNPCTPEGCILCPGQDPSDLPPECTDPECPELQTPCTGDADCTSTQYCSIGCCINRIG